ncbi:hypothetical protein SCHPADRAFT_65736 [Schizopora paradoxa]|uniref:Uncharacterized protein n=1 Tax=Schizopora paradoxa TaxID=27342 RepID=A0A0H2S6G4_9AGAM|nr:hypothetical protein SCHPADRAFT_65736 [Schizopora paradoxa]
MEAEDDDLPEHEYIVMLDDDMTREEFDALIQEVKSQGMTVKSKTFSTVSKFQIKSLTVKATDENIEAFKSLRSNRIRYCERNQTVRMQPSRRTTHQDITKAADEESPEMQRSLTSSDIHSSSKSS